MGLVSQIFFIWSPNLPLGNNSVRVCHFLNFMFPSFFNLFVSKSTCSSGLSAFTQFCLASSLIGNSYSSLFIPFAFLRPSRSVLPHLGWGIWCLKREAMGSGLTRPYQLFTIDQCNLMRGCTHARVHTHTHTHTVPYTDYQILPISPGSLPPIGQGGQKHGA